FLEADAPTINSTGQIAFSGETFRGFGAFLYSNGVLQKVVAPGDRIPPRGSITFADLPQGNDAGEVAFGAALATGEDAVFIAVPPDDQEAGDLAILPGAPDPATPHSRTQLKARHPRNFSLEQSPNDHGK